MFCSVFRIWLVLLGGLVPGVSGIEISTPSEMEAVNGTDVKLKCSFTSTNPVTLQTVTVSWSFRAINSKVDESLLYYHEKAYPNPEGRFKNQVVWSGDVLKRDASITLQAVQPSFNGTYICQVKNNPDVHGSSGEIVLRVVDRVTLSEMSILVAAVGGACAVVLIILAIVVGVRLYRKRRMDTNIELHSKEPGRSVL